MFRGRRLASVDGAGNSGGAASRNAHLRAQPPPPSKGPRPESKKWVSSALLGPLLFLVLPTVSFVLLYHSSSLRGNVAAEKAPVARNKTAPVSRASDGAGDDGAERRYYDEDDSRRLPRWAKEYFEWHARQRRTLARRGNDGGGARFLVLRCLRSDRACGGLSDRIKSLPLFLIWLAAKHRRVFFIYWNKPCGLEQFVVPPPLPKPTAAAATTTTTTTATATVGLDWRPPGWLADRIRRGEGRFYKNAEPIFRAAESNETLVCVKLQDQHGGSAHYNREHGPGAYRQVYGALFRSLFQPSPPLARALRREQQIYHLGAPGSYVAAHLRALYVPPLPAPTVPGVAANAINCASRLRPRVPIFFASDSALATGAAREYAQRRQKQEHGRTVVTIDRSSGDRNGTAGRAAGKDPLHLDKASSRDPADYYDVFLDMFHFANAACISHGQGGFGRLGVLVSRNATCLFPFVKDSRIVECDWRD